LQSSLALWRLRLASELLFIGDAGDTEASRASKRSGVEWTNYWKLQRWLLLDLNFAASKARFSVDDPAGNHIPGSIDKVASMGLTVTDWQGWFGALQWRYFGPRPLVEDNSQRSAATSLAYLRLGRQIDKNLRLSLDIFNLFDRKVSDIDYFYASRLRGEPLGGVNDLHFHPVEPRTLRATLQLNF
jgi:outer membrane receptor protein involved in Fe transport